MDQSDQVNVRFSPSNLECNMGNETGAPLGIKPGLRGRSNLPGRGHIYATRTQASEALPALDSGKNLLKRRHIRLPSKTTAVAPTPLCQGKKSSAKARGHSECLWLGREPGFDGREEISQGPPFLCWSQGFSPRPYMTTTSGQQLIVLPSMQHHEAFALSNPCSDQTPLPCSSLDCHPPEPQGPVASDQASDSATFECEEVLEAAAALMTLKNSSWTWR
ncbi:Doublesex- and mab-3-related transcription factor C1 [Lemmus lemmus]